MPYPVLLAGPCACCPGRCYLEHPDRWCCVPHGCERWLTHPWQGVCCCTSDIPVPLPEATLTIEQREQQEDFPLTNRWGEPVRVNARLQVAGYDDGLAVCIDGAVWEVPIVQALDKFRSGG